MTDRDKVIGGLESLETRLVECGDKLDASVVQNALALLKAQEPRLMTLEEVRLLCEDDIVWYEHKGVQPHPRVVEFVFDDHITFTDGGAWSFSADGYGERWRLWTSKPNEKARAETPWDVGTVTG